MLVLCWHALCWPVCVLQEGRKRYSAEPSPEDMAHFWRMSPVAHLASVRGPMIFMLGAKDRRVRGCH